MLTYTVHQPRHPPTDRFERAESLVFIKDGFTWTAALFAPIWMLAHRLWLPFLGYLAICGALEAVRWAAALDSDWMTLSIMGLHLLVGFEADMLRRWKLDRQGWRAIGSVTARTWAECERQFFEEWLPAQPVVPPPVPAYPASGPPPLRKTSTPILGSLIGARS